LALIEEDLAMNRATMHDNPSPLNPQIETMYLEILGPAQGSPAIRNVSLLSGQPDQAIGENYTTYSAGEVPFEVLRR
jgi:hypothetical protein